VAFCLAAFCPVAFVWTLYEDDWNANQWYCKLHTVQSRSSQGFLASVTVRVLQKASHGPVNCFFHWSLTYVFDMYTFIYLSFDRQKLSAPCVGCLVLLCSRFYRYFTTFYLLCPVTCIVTAKHNKRVACVHAWPTLTHFVRHLCKVKRKEKRTTTTSRVDWLTKWWRVDRARPAD